ncbi:MAG TPA: hypothetical protein DIT25_03960 [Candidatus Moranbacteria bacterium]|nr:hypothetical protein [Candidatus Moranbacteria bacterium]
MHRSAGAIIRNEEGKILMMDRKKFPFGWACPAGHVDEGESPDQAVVREIKEEMNLDVKDPKLLIHEFVGWNECSKGVKGHDWFLFEITEWTGEVEGSGAEAKSFAWKNIEEIKTLQLEPVWEYWFKKLRII